MCSSSPILELKLLEHSLQWYLLLCIIMCVYRVFLVKKVFMHPGWVHIKRGVKKKSPCVFICATMFYFSLNDLLHPGCPQLCSYMFNYQNGKVNSLNLHDSANVASDLKIWGDISGTGRMDRFYFKWKESIYQNS